jgi:HEAT repeat protein
MSNASESLAALAETFHSAPDWRERRRSLRAIARLEGEESTDLLVEGLDDLDPDVKRAAVEGLIRKKDRKGLRAVLRPKMAESADPFLRKSVAKAMSILASDLTLDTLLDLLEDPDWTVRAEAFLVCRDWADRLGDSDDEDSAGILIQMLVIEDPELHGVILKNLRRIGHHVVPLLVESLESKSRFVRAGAAHVLGRLNIRGAFANIADVIGDPAWEVRFEATKALGLLKMPGGIQPLIDRLSDARKEVREAAVESLAGFGPDIVETLHLALKFTATRLKTVNLILTIGRIRDERSILELVRYLFSPYHTVRREATAALIGYGKNDRLVEHLLGALTFLDLDLEPLLKIAREPGNVRLRIRAIRAIGETREHRAVPALEELLDDPVPLIRSGAEAALKTITLAVHCRRCAVRALGYIGDKRAVPILIDMLRKEESEVARSSVPKALTRLNAVEAVPALLEATRCDIHPTVRAEAAMAAIRLGPEEMRVADCLLEALHDPEKEVRSQAIRGLGRFGCLRALEKLEEMKLDPIWGIRRDAENAIRTIKARVNGKQQVTENEE